MVVRRSGMVDREDEGFVEIVSTLWEEVQRSLRLASRNEITLRRLWYVCVVCVCVCVCVLMEGELKT